MSVLVQAAKLFWATLREIFDEAAYERFLTRHGMPSSPSAYSAYLQESCVAKAKRPRCC